LVAFLTQGRGRACKKGSGKRSGKRAKIKRLELVLKVEVLVEPNWGIKRIAEEKKNRGEKKI